MINQVLLLGLEVERFTSLSINMLGKYYNIFKSRNQYVTVNKYIIIYIIFTKAQNYGIIVSLKETKGNKYVNF